MNKNSMRLFKETEKERKIGVAINTSFGSSGNLNKTKKNYPKPGAHQEKPKQEV